MDNIINLSNDNTILIYRWNNAYDIYFYNKEANKTTRIQLSVEAFNFLTHNVNEEAHINDMRDNLNLAC